MGLCAETCTTFARLDHWFLVSFGFDDSRANRKPRLKLSSRKRTRTRLAILPIARERLFMNDPTTPLEDILTLNQSAVRQLRPIADGCKPAVKRAMLS